MAARPSATRAAVGMAPASDPSCDVARSAGSDAPPAPDAEALLAAAGVGAAGMPLAAAVQ